MRVRRYAVRDHSGGRGQHAGGDGIIREFEFLAPASATLLTECHRHAPWGTGNDSAGHPGLNLLNGAELPGKSELELVTGDRLTLLTPDGGGNHAD